MSLVVQNLSKGFLIKNGRAKKSLKEAIYHKIYSNKQKEVFWALKKISFRLEEGDCLGILGKNGAGKSTLIKILAKIMEPSSGKAIYRGRLASLIEVGAGFHPDLTGKENIFLNGAILGMSRQTIERNMDGIVEFAEIEPFLNTPVKHFSSGMHARLGFAIAVFSDPDLLIIDEALSVGDEVFQKKALKKIEEFTQLKKTIIFIGHNVNRFQNFCKKGLILEKGEVQFMGPIDQAIEKYRGEL